jgi:hypothetical protein
MVPAPSFQEPPTGAEPQPLALWTAAGALPMPRVGLAATSVLIILLGWFTLQLGGEWFERVSTPYHRH